MIRAERIAQEVGFLDGDVQEVGLAGGLVMGDGRLEQMAGVVKLVAVNRVHLPALVAGPWVRMLGIDRASGVEVAVRFLGGADLGDQVVQVSLHLRIGLNGQRIRGAFEHLIGIGIVERIPRRLLVGEGFAAQGLGRPLEVVHTAGFLALLESERDGDQAIGFDARRPEDIVKVHCGERDGLDRVVVSDGSPLCEQA